MKALASAALLAGLMIQPLHAQGLPPASPADTLQMARQGFTPAQAAELRSRYSYKEVISAGDVSLYYFLNIGQWLQTAIAGRQGSFADLAAEANPAIGAARFSASPDGAALRDYLKSPRSRAQGMIVMHRGRIVFEEYPGMRATDRHVWMSISKTTASLVVRLLAEEGRIDVEKPIDQYVASLRNTAWAGTRVIDVLDMTSGMDVVETQKNRENPRSIISRYNLAVTGEPNASGKREKQFEVIRSARRLGPAGKSFDYSSLNTTVLTVLAEQVEKKQWADIFQERVWGKMTVEGDMQVGVATDGTPQAHGLLATRLRDLARYGMLYTPSWGKAARTQIVSDAYVKQIQTGGRKDIYLKGELGNRMTTATFPASPPTANHWQWDGVWDDGDFYKGGVYGQGLYVSPGKDLVIAWFSTVMSTDLTQYARRIATDTPR